MRREIVYLGIGFSSWLIATCLAFSIEADSLMVGFLFLGLVLAGLLPLTRDPFNKTQAWSDRTRLEKLQLLATVVTTTGVINYLQLEIPEFVAAIRHWQIQIGILMFYVYRAIRFYQSSSELHAKSHR